MASRAQTVTILFTDLVGSTELMQREGDERAQGIFKAHHRLLREAVEQHAGHEVQWLGDGMMVAFDSTADAVKCAIAMQQASRRPTAGERLEIRAGLNVGEAIVDEDHYFGTTVVVARRLCDSCGAGQIRASDIVVRLLEARGDGIRSKDLGALDLKGIAKPVPAVEIVYAHDPMSMLRRLPFVGRDAEYETMLKRFGEARSGRGAVVLLAGEPGIGKTRLTEEFCDHAAAVGATVIRGNCYEGDVAAPFSPWTEALRSLLDQTPDAELRGTLGPGAPDVAALLPEIRRRVPDLEESPQLEPEAERARLFDSIDAWLRNVAEQKPLVIFLDDLQWCDRPSLALLRQVARKIQNQSVILVGTYRDVEVDRVHPLAQTLASLRRMEHQERLAIRGFTQGSILQLLAAIEPSEETLSARQALAQRLHQESEGNPFFIREVLNNLVETGKLVQRDGVWIGTVESVEQLGIPEGIKEVVGRRLSQLSEVCNRMLARASAMTGGFTWDQLRAICDDSEGDLLDALDEALRSQLIAEKDRETYAFTHALIRATLYDELSTPRRVQVHRRIAESLESLYADRIDDHLGELAAHYMASTGNAAEKATEYSIRAGDRAVVLLAWEDAVAHYERALAAMDLEIKSNDERRCAVLLALATVQRRSAAPTEATQRIREALTIARQLGQGALLARAAQAFAGAAYELEDPNVAAESLVFVDEALAATKGDTSAQRVHLLCARVRVGASVSNADAGASSGGAMGAGLRGDRDPTIVAFAHEALALAEELRDNAAIWAAARTLHVVSRQPDNLIERMELLERVSAAADAIGPISWGYNYFKACDALEFGDIEKFEQFIPILDDELIRARSRRQVHVPRAMLVTLLTARGEFESAKRIRAEYAAASRSSDAQGSALTQISIIRILEGRFAELEQAYLGLARQFPGDTGYPVSLALLYALDERFTDATRVIDEMLSNGSIDLPRDAVWTGYVCLLADACAAAGHREAAEFLYPRLVDYAWACSATSHTVTLGSMARVIGRLATVLGKYDEAVQHFERGLAANERMGLHAWTTWTRLNYADMLLRRNRPGDRERATPLLRQAHDFAQKAGMGCAERDSARLLAT